MTIHSRLTGGHKARLKGHYDGRWMKRTGHIGSPTFCGSLEERSRQRYWERRIERLTVFVEKLSFTATGLIAEWIFLSNMRGLRRRSK
jgi:hypothetical protein